MPSIVSNLRPLIGEANGDAARADGFGPFGEDWAKAGRRSREHAEPGIELVGEPGARRRNREGDDLAGQRG